MINHNVFAAGGIASLYLLALSIIGRYSWFLLRHKRSGLEKPPPPPLLFPIMRRPVEFGPLLRPQADIDAMCAAIIADQLALRQESPKQRRRRLSHQDGTERDRVLHWLWHWEDAGRAVRRARYPAEVLA